MLNFKAAQYANIFAILGNTFIVPKHVFSSLSNIATASVANPVGTGPYVLKSFTTQQVTFTANPKWWGGKPAVTQVNIPYYSGNTAATTALAAGQLDWAGNEIPNLKQLYTSKDPTNNHYWFPGGNNGDAVGQRGQGRPTGRPQGPPGDQRGHQPPAAVEQGRVRLRGPGDLLQRPDPARAAAVPGPEARPTTCPPRPTRARCPRS